MSATCTIFRKELRSYLATPYGWIILALVMIMQGLSMSTTLKVFQLQPQKEGLLYFVLHTPTFWFYFIFLFPIITMRSLAEEERAGTLEALLTTPITTSNVVIGKYLATYVYYIILWAPLLLYPCLADIATWYASMKYNMLGTAEGGQAIQATMDVSYRLADWAGSYSILLLIGAWFTALGVLASSLTNSQIIASIISVGMLVFVFFLGQIPILWGTNFPMAGLFRYISCSDHINEFSSGLIDTRPVVFYLSMAVFTIILTIRIVDYRRWRR